MSDPTIAAWSRESDLLFQLRQLREENERLREDKQSVDAVDTLTEEGWIWDGDQWQRPSAAQPCSTCEALARTVMMDQTAHDNFKPDWDATAVMVEEQQRMAKRIEDLEAMLTRQTARIVELQEHIDNFDGEDR